MEEEPKNEKKPEFKGNLAFIWLIGILVILLGCTVFYTLKITKENEELKQTPVEVAEQQSQAIVQNSNLSSNEDVTNYKGTWYQYEDMDYLKIKSINDGKIVFDWFIYRIDEYDDVTATLNEDNIAYFTSKDDLDTHEISGRIILKNNTVTVEVIELIDKDSLVEKGYSIIFDKKKESINENEVKQENSKTNVTNKKIYTDSDLKEIKETIENYYKLLTAKDNSPLLMLTDVLNFTVQGVQDPDYAPSNFIEHPNPYKYAWTGINYKEFRGEIWYISDDVLKKNFSEFVEYKDYLYVADNNIIKYNFKYKIVKQEIDKNSTKNSCICDVTIKNSKTGKTFKNRIKMTRGNGNFVIGSVNKK